MNELRIYAASADGVTRLTTPAGARTLHDLALPDGIYEGLRTFGRRKFLYLERHLDRARRSAAELGWEPIDEPCLRRALDTVAAEFSPEGEPHSEAVIRFDVFEHEIEVLGTRTRYLFAVAKRVPIAPEILRDGCAVGIAHGKSRLLPEIKQNEWIQRRRGTGPGDRGFFEYLLVDDAGRILEGSSSNIFCVRDGALLTAPSNVLAGIQRGVFLEVARDIGIEVREEAVALAELDDIDEMFLTSSSRSAVPIVAVEDRTIGEGKPGPVWRSLVDAYERTWSRARPALSGEDATA